MAPILVVLLGLAVLLYPVVSTQWNNFAQTRAAQAYSQLDVATPPEVNDAQWDAAHEYNRTKNTGVILDPWLARVSKDNIPYQEYLSQLNSSDVMGRIIVPGAKADLPIYHGTDDKTLSKGVGHLFGSDLPVGGQSTHSVLTGHTGLPNATLFDNLTDVKKGQAFYVQVAGHKLKYEVHDIRVVEPHETDSLRPVEGQDLMTLITCTPYGVNTHRLLVTGHQVPMDPKDEGVFDQKGPHIQWWMWAILAFAVLVLIALARWVYKMRQKSIVAQHDNEGDSTNA
nr:class C sortase [Corynebacterium tapiri]